MVGEKKEHREIQWCQRKGWSSNPNTKGFTWNATPSFSACIVRVHKARTVLVNTHPITDILPVPVSRTSSAKHIPSKSLADKQQNIRLAKL